MPRPRKDFPISFCLSLRKRGYSYEMIAWKLQQLGYDVSKWTVMRRLRDFAPSTQHIQHENPGFNAEKFEETGLDLLAGEVESFDELMERLEGCDEA